MERKKDKFIKIKTPKSFLSMSIPIPPCPPVLTSKHIGKELREDTCKTEKYSRHTVKGLCPLNRVKSKSLNKIG